MFAKFLARFDSSAYALKHIQEVFLHCGHSNADCGYSFCLLKSTEEWLLSAECCVDGRENPVTLTNHPVRYEDAEKLLETMQQQNVIHIVRCYKELKRQEITLDEPSYHLAIKMDNGEVVAANALVCKEMETFFYHLAETYAE